MGSIRRLLAPLSYLRIEREDKVTDEVIIPALLTFLSVGTLWYFSGRIPVFSDKGVISFIVGYLQIVSGFYIASLAAVATFNKESMDKPMPGIPVVLPVTRKSKGAPETLSRRRFLCFLFGYLSLLSLVLYFSGSALILLAPHIKSILSAGALEVVKWLVVSVYIFTTYNLLVTTLLGLYYMTDRIHRKDAAFVQPSDSADVEQVVSDDDED